MRLKSLIFGGGLVAGVVIAGIFAASIIIAKYREKAHEFSTRANLLNEHRKCQIQQQHRGRPNAGKPRRPITSSPKILYSSGARPAAHCLL